MKFRFELSDGEYFTQAYHYNNETGDREKVVNTFISNYGRVINCYGKELATDTEYSGTMGYRSFRRNVYDGHRKVQKRYKLSRVLASTFSPQGHFKGAHVDHINDNHKDDRVDNLQWVSGTFNHNKRNLRQGWGKYSGK